MPSQTNSYGKNKKIVYPKLMVIFFWVTIKIKDL